MGKKLAQVQVKIEDRLDGLASISIAFQGSTGDETYNLYKSVKSVIEEKATCTNALFYMYKKGETRESVITALAAHQRTLIPERWYLVPQRIEPRDFSCSNWNVYDKLVKMSPFYYEETRIITITDFSRLKDA